MSDLRNLLEEAAGPPLPGPPPDYTAAALVRGRRALSRRRLRRRVTASTGVIAAVAMSAVLAFSAPGRAPGQSPTGPTQLVAYTGQQPVGFTLDKVPEGWHVETTDSYGIVLAPDDMAGVSKDPRVVEDKISLDLQLQVPQLVGDMVSVNGRPGVVFHNWPVDYTNEDPGRTLYIEQTTRKITLDPCTKDEKLTIKRDHLDLRFYRCGTAVRTPYLSIQIPGTLHWNDQEFVEFAEAIHITKEATFSG